MIDCRYGPGGSLVCDERPPWLDEPELRGDVARYYGGKFLIAESMTRKTAETIAKALGLNLQPTKDEA